MNKCAREMHSIFLNNNNNNNIIIPIMIGCMFTVYKVKEISGLPAESKRSRKGGHLWKSKKHDDRGR